MASIGKLMKQAAKMQRQMQEAQAQLAEQTVEASSGGGAVKVVASCDGSVKSIRIDPDAVDSDEITMLEDLVAAAFRDGLRRCGNAQAAAMARVGSIALPDDGG